MKIHATGTAIVLSILLGVTAAGASGSTGDSAVEKNWGMAFHAAKKAQIANPGAGAVTGPVRGFDGIAAKKAMDGYHESFSQQTVNQGYSLDSISVISGGGMR